MLPTPPSSVRNPEQLPRVLNTWILFIGKQSLYLATVQQEWNYEGLVQSGLDSKPDDATAPCHIHPGQATVAVAIPTRMFVLELSSLERVECKYLKSID